MKLLSRLLLYLLLALGATRMILYFAYAAAMLPTPLESHNLESKMVLLAYRAQRGLSLYPDWSNGPYLSNWFGPVAPLLVGLVGRCLQSDVRGLFLIGRALSFGACLLTTFVVAVAIARREGRGAGLAGGILSLGSAPTFGFTVMVRPDTLAELLGVGGFLLWGSRRAPARWAGAGLLILAVLTKQTAAIYLLAAVLVPIVEGLYLRGASLLAASGICLIGVVAAVTTALEPNFARSLAGESIMPWDLAAWRVLLERILITCPDILLLPAIGLYLWLRRPPRAVRPAALVLLLLAAALGLSGKIGADMNYYLCLRVAEAFAAGALWSAVHATGSPPAGPPTPRPAVLAAAALLAVGSVAFSIPTDLIFVQLSRGLSRFYATADGRSALRSYQDAFALARNDRVRLLTDSGVIDLYQGERALFGDPWLFRVLVETGRLQPSALVQRIAAQDYDIIITVHDLGSPGYFREDFRLPRLVVEQVLVHYTLRQKVPGLFLYGHRRRDRGP